MMYAVIIPIIILWVFALIQWIGAKIRKRRIQKLKILCNMMYGKAAKNYYDENNGKHI